MKPTPVTAVPSARRPRSPHRSASEEAPLAPSLGEESRRDLGRRHRPRIKRFDQADLGQRQRELRLPERQQEIDRIRESVVQEMGPAARAERRPPLARERCRRAPGGARSLNVLAVDSEHNPEPAALMRLSRTFEGHEIPKQR